MTAHSNAISTGVENEPDIAILRGGGPPRVRVDHPAFGSIEYVPPSIHVAHEPGGALTLRAGWELGPLRSNLAAYLRENAYLVPDRLFLADRPGGNSEWRRLNYGDARARADRIAQALLDRGFQQGDVIAILAPASIEHGLLMLGALTAGIAVAPISPSYAAIPQARPRLVETFRATRARMLLVQDAGALAGPLASLELGGAELVSIAPADGATDFAELLTPVPTEAVSHAYRAVDGDTVAKILFTSGSTGSPKGVINTHRMLCANQQMTGELTLRDPSNPPILLDWLPWHHTFAGNFIFGDTLRNASSLYLDDGKPVAGAFARTIEAIREIRPTTYTNVPAGYAMLADAMERDESLRDAFFSRIQLMRYGGAGLSAEVYERLQLMAEAVRGKRIPMICAFAMTETSPSVTALHWPYDGVGCLGLPYAGVDMRLLPFGEGRYEIRLRGPSVFPGYLGDPELTRAAFDEEGYFITGDACRFAVPGDIESGLIYDGRVSEEFKLETGTWVHVGALRMGLLEAASPLLKDLVLTGDHRAYVGALAWLSDAEAARCKSADGILVPCDDVRRRLGIALAEWNRLHQGSSRRIERLLVMAEPPVFADGEINDKAYVNQRGVVRRRAALVERLYCAADGPGVILPIETVAEPAQAC